jgi:hypothetical protein
MPPLSVLQRYAPAASQGSQRGRHRASLTPNYIPRPRDRRSRYFSPYVTVRSGSWRLAARLVRAQVPGMPGLRVRPCALFRVSVAIATETRNKAGTARDGCPGCRVWGASRLASRKCPGRAHRCRAGNRIIQNTEAYSERWIAGFLHSSACNVVYSGFLAGSCPRWARHFRHNPHIPRASPIRSEGWGPQPY